MHRGGCDSLPKSCLIFQQKGGPRSVGTLPWDGKSQLDVSGYGVGSLDPGFRVHFNSMTELMDFAKVNAWGCILLSQFPGSLGFLGSLGRCDPVPE